jgi:GT2 family glycosyltransferase
MFADALPSISVVIPTKDRPDEVMRMLSSLREQHTMPLEVIVVDQSTPAYILQPFPQLVHLHEPQIGGLTAARNRGVDSARGDVVLFFDDDVLLETDCVREIALAFAARRDLVGAQCSISNPRYNPERSLFELSERIFRHGFFDPRPRIYRGEIIPRLIAGLASAYRRDLFESERFDEALTGYGLAEDWDMTMRARRHGSLTTVPAARVRHEESPKNRADFATFAKMRRRNFLYLYHKLNADRNPVNRLCLQWFLLGEHLRDLKHRISGEIRPSSG